MKQSNKTNVTSLGLLFASLAVAAFAGEPAPAAAWPCRRGLNGNGSAPEPGFELVDDMSKAKLLWTREE